jgi:hypothetical protein
MLNISPYELPGRIGASAAAGGAAAVTGFPVGAGLACADAELFGAPAKKYWQF